MENFINEINKFLPANIQKIGKITDSSIIFRLDNESFVKYLYLVPNERIRAIAFSEQSPKQEYNLADWLGPCLHKLLETKIIKIEKRGNILSLFFDNGYSLDVHFFGGNGNAILLNQENVIAAAMFPGKFFASGNKYDFSKNISHSNTKINILSVDAIIKKINEENFNNTKLTIEKHLLNEKKKLIRRLKKIKKDLNDVENIDALKLSGELLKANYHLLKRGQSSIKLKNYFSTDGEEIEIKLDPAKKPQENVAKYFKKAKKLERGQKLIKQRLEITEKEIKEIDEKLNDLSTIQFESESLSPLSKLTKFLPVKKKAKNKKSKKKNGSSENIKIRKFVSSDGFDILTGKNAKENDYLTVRLANGNDMWLHTRNHPGAHVVIRAKRGEKFPKNTLIEAAKLCAHFSKAKNGSLEDITYTLKKNVTKPKGVKPGTVFVAAGKTITIQYNEREIKNWINKNKIGSI